MHLIHGGDATMKRLQARSKPDELLVRKGPPGLSLHSAE
jgi:hypothetical protein